MSGVVRPHYFFLSKPFPKYTHDIRLLSFVSNVLYFCSHLTLRTFVGVSWDDSATKVVLPATPAVYNMYTAQWTTTFISKKDTPPRPVPTTPPPSIQSGESGGRGTATGEVVGGTVTRPSGVDNSVTGAPKSNNAAIIGGAVGGGVVIVSIAVVVAVLVVRRRRNSRRRVSLPKEFWNI